MRSSTLALLAPFMVATAMAGCYSGGAEGNKKTALDSLSITCKQIGGYYVSHQKRDTCVSVKDAGVSWYFEVKNDNGDGRSLSVDTCVSGLKTEIEGCPKGGRNTKDGWQFM